MCLVEVIRRSFGFVQRQLSAVEDGLHYGQNERSILTTVLSAVPCVLSMHGFSSQCSSWNHRPVETKDLLLMSVERLLLLSTGLTCIIGTSIYQILIQIQSTAQCPCTIGE
jgi:hypothetical protein